MAELVPRISDGDGTLTLRQAIAGKNLGSVLSLKCRGIKITCQRSVQTDQPDRQKAIAVFKGKSHHGPGFLKLRLVR